MTKKFKKYLFIVEGSTDKDFMNGFIKLFIENEGKNQELDISEDNFGVEKITRDGGKSEFFKNESIDNIIDKIEFFSNDEILTKTYLIVDADWEINNSENQPAGHKQTEKKIKEIEAKVIEHSFIRSHNDYKNAKIDHFIMPYNKETQEFGELETLFINSLKPEFQNKLKCLDDMHKCLAKQHPKPVDNHHRDKIRMQILLNSYDVKMKNAINWIDYNNENLDDLKNFLRNKFKKITKKNQKK